MESEIEFSVIPHKQRRFRIHIRKDDDGMLRFIVYEDRGSGSSGTDYQHKNYNSKKFDTFDEGSAGQALFFVKYYIRVRLEQKQGGDEMKEKEFEEKFEEMEAKDDALREKVDTIINHDLMKNWLELKYG